MSNDPSLDDLRREIDAIDDQIHDLLMRRTDIVGRIGAVKSQEGATGLALRPGREAEIIRRIVSRHDGPFPLAVVVRIWRELLSAQTAVQGQYTVGVFAPEDVAAYRDLGRDQFGAWVPIRKYQAVNQVVQDVWNGKISIGILPYPVGERTDPWWRSLVAFGDDIPRIIARLPFFESLDEDSGQQTAVAIAKISPEPTGDDVTLVAIERLSDVSRDRLREDLIKSGLDAEWIASWQDPSEAGHALFLASIEDFLETRDPRIDVFRERLGEAAGRIMVLGSYPRPISARTLKAAE